MLYYKNNHFGILKARTCILLARELVLLKGVCAMKELKLDLLPGNLYAAKKREKQSDKEKKNREQKNIVRLTDVTIKVEKTKQ